MNLPRAAAILGGLSVAAKHLWDYYGLGRTVAHQAYPQKDLSDLLYFVAPLLLLFAMLGMSRLNSSNVAPSGRSGLRLAIAGVGLWAIGAFGEAWTPELFTWGIVAATGFSLLGAGLIRFGLARNPYDRILTMPLLLGLLVFIYLGVIFLPYSLWGEQRFSTGVAVWLMTVWGLGWVVIGYQYCPNRRQDVPPVMD